MLVTDAGEMKDVEFIQTEMLVNKVYRKMRSSPIEGSEFQELRNLHNKH